MNFKRRVNHVQMIVALIVVSICAFTIITSAQSSLTSTEPGAAGESYSQMPLIAPIGMRTGKYIDIPALSQGPAIDADKGYRVKCFGKGLYIVTENVYQAMFLVYDRGVVVVDAPPTLAAHIPKAIAEVSDKPITHVIYSHSHADHIGATKALGGSPIIILNEKTTSSQIIGGIVGGIGMALLENTVSDHSGRIVNASFGDYLVAVNADVPDIDVVFVGGPDPMTATGTKGIGELALTGICAAIANAVYHATGRRVRSLPISLEDMVLAS